MANFTPISAAIGGALIGLAATLLMLLAGRIAGISGIFGAVLGLGTGDRAWRARLHRRTHPRARRRPCWWATRCRCRRCRRAGR